MKLSIIIPVYNEKNTILEILKKLNGVVFGSFQKEIIIVDDCSTDGTRKIIESLPVFYKTIFHKENRGKGSAIRSGLQGATGDYVVIQDADMEYDPNDLKTMLEKMIAENLNILYGSRRLKKENTQYSGLLYYFGGLLLTVIVNILYRQRLTDEPTCYKMFRTEFIKGLPLQCQRFEFCPEVTALASLKGEKIKEIPISYFPRNKKEGKKIKWYDALVAIKVLLKYRFFNMSWQKVLAGKRIYLLLFALGIVNLVVFGYLFGFHSNNDTDSFIWTIQRFRGIEAPLYTTRFLNPFYPIIAATILRWASPALSIIIINTVFYFGIILYTFKLISNVFKSRFIGLVSALIIVSAYPMLRYALTQVQDIGGYFWFLLTIYMGWLWWTEKKDRFLYVGGLAVGMGMLVKESGAMGALFVAVLFLMDKSSIKNKIKYFLKFSWIPFVILVINQFQARSVHYNSAQWFLDNWRMFGHEFTFFKWLGVNITTYNFLWVFILLGIFILIKNFRTISKDIKIYLLAVLPASLCYFAWPIYIGRTVFISAWFFVPIAVYAIYRIFIKGGYFRYVAILGVFLVVITPYILQHTIRYAHLFMIINDCNKNISCSWNYFWTNRESFSKLK